MLIRQVVGLNSDFLKMLVDNDYLAFLENEPYELNNLIFLLATDEVEEEHAGYALFNLCDRAEKIYELIHIQVNLDYMDSRVGSQLLDRGKEIIKNEGGGLIKAPIPLNDYENCLGFFEKTGFKKACDVSSISYNVQDLKASPAFKDQTKLKDWFTHIIPAGKISFENKRLLESRFGCDFGKFNVEYTNVFFIDINGVALVSFFKKENSLILGNAVFDSRLKDGRDRIFFMLVANIILECCTNNIEKIAFNNLEESRLDELVALFGEPAEKLLKKQLLLTL